MTTYRQKYRPVESFDGIIAVVAFELGVLEADVVRILLALVDDALDETAAGRDVVWPWIGRFRKREIKARAIKSPKTGIARSYPARVALGYVPSKTARGAVASLPGFVWPKGF